MRLSNNNEPFSDNLITPTNKIKVYTTVDFQRNLHIKGIENRHKLGINLEEPV